MFGTLVRNWWVVLIRGLLAIAFGVIALLAPLATLRALVIVFGLYALVDGVAAIFAAVWRQAGDPPWWALTIEGVVGIGAGLVAFVWPGLTALTLLWVIAFWAIVTGVFAIVTAVRLRREVSGELLYILAGLASVALGVLMLARPLAGALSLVWLIGLYAIVAGVLFIGASIRLHGVKHRIGQLPGELPHPV